MLVVLLMASVMTIGATSCETHFPVKTQRNVEKRWISLLFQRENLKKASLINNGFRPNPCDFIYIWTKIVQFLSKSMVFYQIWTKIVLYFGNLL